MFYSVPSPLSSLPAPLCPLPRAGDRHCQHGLQPRQARPPIGRNGHDGNAQLAFQPGEIDTDAALLGHVEHVDGQHGGQSQFEHLANQIEAALKVAGVGNAHDRIDRRDSLSPPQQQIDDHDFVARAGGQAVEAGQVDHFQPSPGQAHLARLLFDGYARIIADVLMDSYQAAEERRLSRVRIADQGNGESACFRRAFNVLEHLLSGRRLDQHVQQVVGAEADFVAGPTDDARIPRAKHLDFRAAAQSEFLQPVNVIGMTYDLDDLGEVPTGQVP